MITLMQGDCLDLMGKIPSVNMVLADLPYGTTACKWDSVIPLAPLWEHYKRVCTGGAIVLTAAQPFTSLLVVSNVEQFAYCWNWVKNKPTGFPNANCQPLRNVEDVCIFGKGKANPNATVKIPYFPQGLIESKRVKIRKAPKSRTVNNGESDGSLIGEYESNFTNYPNQTLYFDSESGTIHPTQKPVALMEYLIRTYTNEGDTVLDNTMGSGTTGIACINTNRNFIGMEKDPDIFATAKKRIREHELNSL